MIVKKVLPQELTRNLVFRLNYLHHVKLEEFVVMADWAGETLYVNRKVPQKDIDGFLEVIMFPDYCVIDPEGPTGQFLEYVYKKYGFHVYNVLVDSHKWYMEQKESQQAEERARAIVALIEKEVNSENPIVAYDERLMHEIWKIGYRLDRKTPQKLTNYGSVYEFYYGYLLGAGLLKGGAV